MPEFAKIGSLHPGDIVKCTGFDCVRPGPHTVCSSDDGLYIRCDQGRHYLAGQEDGDVYIGVTRAT